MKVFNDISTRPFPYAPIDTTYGPATYHEGMLLPYSRIGIEGENLFAFVPQGNYANQPTVLPNDFMGSFTRVNYVLEKAINPHIINWLGLFKAQDGGTIDFPIGSNNPYSGNGTHTGTVALYWQSPANEGLYRYYWKRYLEILSRAVKVDYKVLLDLVTYKNTDLNQRFIKIEALYYLCQKAQMNMPFPEVSTLTLVRL